MAIYKIGISGESFYQPAISKCERADDIYLEKEPQNPYDPNAIAVYLSKTKNKIGHIKRDQTHWISEVMDKGQYEISVIELPKIKKNIAVVLLLDTTPEESRRAEQLYRAGKISAQHILSWVDNGGCYTVIVNAETGEEIKLGKREK